MSEQATTKQIDYILQLQQEWAYLLDAEMPDWSTDPGVKMSAKAVAAAQYRRELDATEGHGTDGAVRIAELEASAMAEMVAKRTASWRAKQAALVAPVDGLSKAEASALIDDLN